MMSLNAMAQNIMTGTALVEGNSLGIWMENIVYKVTTP
jgi:hypothetical protein